MASIDKGSLLIAEPFMKDNNFNRAVILICENNPDGTFGLVINQTFPMQLQELIPEVNSKYFPVYLGGPVNIETLHFIHTYPDLISGGIEISKGIFWGGNFDEVKTCFEKGLFSDDRIRFYLGYSGWGRGQLEEELKQNTWITGKARRKLIFQTQPDKIWSTALIDLGEEYHHMVLSPADPSLN